MAFQTKAGARAYGIAQQMQLRAALENHPQHVMHVLDTINYVNAVGEHCIEVMKQYVDQHIDNLVKIEVDRKMNDSRVKLKVDEKSLQATKSAIKSIFDSFNK